MVLNDAHAANVEIGVAQSLGQMGDGGGNVGGQTVVILGNNGIYFIGLRCCCDGEPECEPCEVCFYEPLMMTNRFASETA